MIHKLNRRKVIKTCALAGISVISGCGLKPFNYRGIHKLEAFGEGEGGFLANVDWIKPNHSTLVYLKEEIPIIIANVDGEIKAYKSLCPHTNCELNDGERYQPIDIRNREVRCFIHDSYFDLNTGECLRGPALMRGKKYSGLTPFLIRIENGKIYRG